MKFRYLFVVLSSLLLFAACDNTNYIYDENHVLPDAAWTYQDSLVFQLPIADTSARYHLYLDLDHSTEYAYQNLYLQIHTIYPSGKRVNDELSIDLADKAGKWHGKCASEWCKLRVHLQQNAYFNEIGDHRITIEQYMRQSPIKGIRNVSFKLEKIAS